MIASDTAQSARDPLWACLVELAEAAHQQAVDAQASPSKGAREQLGSALRGMAILLDAIAVLDAADIAYG